jgi:ABC-type transporter Mla subunit MlaD
MSSAIDALDTAAGRLDEVLEGAKAAANALDGISDSLVDKVREVASKADDVRSSVVRARDALDQAGV